MTQKLAEWIKAGRQSNPRVTAARAGSPGISRSRRRGGTRRCAVKWRTGERRSRPGAPQRNPRPSGPCLWGTSDGGGHDTRPGAPVRGHTDLDALPAPRVPACTAGSGRAAASPVAGIGCRNGCPAAHSDPFPPGTDGRTARAGRGYLAPRAPAPRWCGARIPAAPPPLPTSRSGSFKFLWRSPEDSPQASPAGAAWANPFPGLCLPRDQSERKGSEAGGQPRWWTALAGQSPPKPDGWCIGAAPNRLAAEWAGPASRALRAPRRVAEVRRGRWRSERKRRRGRGRPRPRGLGRAQVSAAGNDGLRRGTAPSPGAWCPVPWLG